MKNIQSEIKNIPIDSIKPNPYQPRKNFNKQSLEELSQSIKTYGLIQPISVRQLCEDSYELVAGERRLRASEIAELDEIPAIIVDYKDQDSAMIALIENLQREDLNFVEEAEGYYNLIKDHGFTQQGLAEKLGKSQSTIANKLRILKLSDEIKKSLIDNKLTERHARALLKLPDDEMKEEVLNKVIKEDLTVKKTEKLIEDILNDLIKEEESESNQNVKGLINFKIYLNTLKNAYNAIKETGIEAKYKEKDMGDHIEVVVQIPKR
ncbi:nucleoid occlusion protein [Anaerosalibacter bizertensis]|uniref:Nucleoid occlusion protein n=1 Tax=Anaerosalibacter bizertensis TaxID=932217 RepID=A0A844FJR6_9FIRM|nr:nucleoid occlusion protein [Anaerosalibacter bizertensis]MBV1817273.1 nucleoid occlusion protein [Bacteroidales bacterium MSK.15.36]MCB5559969.1 nucleoid occlusion protein [Anaerosalibacter bizertensis]MCG4565338.1 nucleoid occlusion protein [Anaerosalibacter bizertensis]MCG4582435.1 nucleoid occlusion protein [Anaerosalibacter bizertensis]MCG4585037.1 nucleoid occlusion protein [Anaerosalibacter bizertensis]